MLDAYKQVGDTIRHAPPFAAPGTFFRGNLHTHTTASDGDFPAEEVVRRYKDQGYDFLCLSDHFLECYEYPMTDSREFRSPDFTTLIAAELHAGKLLNDELWHVLAVGLPIDFSPPHDNEGIASLARRAYNAGAYIGLVHPEWYGLQPDDANVLPFAHAVEIYNHGSRVENDRGDGWALADILLNRGRQVHAYATDDAHQLTHDAFGGWINVKSTSLDEQSILDALKAGHYYSSQGPLIDDIEIDAQEVRVQCSPAKAVIIAGRGSRSDQVLGESLTEARFSLKKFKSGYFRITIIDSEDRKAWSNPLWMDSDTT